MNSLRIESLWSREYIFGVGWSQVDFRGSKSSSSSSQLLFDVGSRVRNWGVRGSSLKRGVDLEDLMKILGMLFHLKNDFSAMNLGHEIFLIFVRVQYLKRSVSQLYLLCK